MSWLVQKGRPTLSFQFYSVWGPEILLQSNPSFSGLFMLQVNIWDLMKRINPHFRITYTYHIPVYLLILLIFWYLLLMCFWQEEEQQCRGKALSLEFHRPSNYEELAMVYRERSLLRDFSLISRRSWNKQKGFISIEVKETTGQECFSEIIEYVC